VPISSLLTKAAVIAAVATGLAMIGRMVGPKWQPAPTPGAEGRRGRRSMHPGAIFALIFVGLVVVSVLAFVVFIGLWWLASRDCTGSC
jgi:hypothetical protein